MNMCLQEFTCTMCVQGSPETRGHRIPWTGVVGATDALERSNIAPKPHEDTCY